MSLDADVIYGFGFKIVEDQIKSVVVKHALEDISDLFENVKTRLPKGFCYSKTSGEYEPLVVIIKPKEDEYESKLMRGEISPIDFTPVLEWAKKHDVMFSKNMPELHVIPYTS